MKAAMLPRTRTLTELRCERTIILNEYAASNHLGPDKEEANLAKHGLSLALLGRVLDGETATIPDERADYGELRLVTFGYITDRLYVAVWTPRENEIRAISLRKANNREQEQYG